MTIYDDVGELEKIAVNLFYGWGYNFYRLENQLRADDLTVRSKVGWLLGRAREAASRAESDWRRANIPMPTREQPRPDPAALEAAARLERLARDIAALEGQIRAQPVPEADHMTNRYRLEGETLHRLLQCDVALAGRAEALRAMVEEADGVGLLARAGEIETGCKSIARSLRDRQAILQV
ncbi:MAG: hypothetical protein KGM15_00135 [Pseudomonadota bacterium]|nr:hypothetical protein [Pseudomonadota bacterium]